MRCASAALIVAAAIAGCHSPADQGHRIYGYVDLEGRTAIEPAFLDARGFSEGLAAVRVAAGWGYIDHNGDWVIPPRFSAAAPFAEGRAAVQDSTGRWGYVDPTGRMVLPPRFERLSRFVEGRAWGERPDGQVQSIDRDGRVSASSALVDRVSFGDLSGEVEPDPDYPMVVHDLRRLDGALIDAVIRSGRMPVEVDVAEDERLTGYEDLAGRAVIDARFEEAFPFVDGLAQVKSDQGVGFIDLNGQVVVPLEFDSALLRFSRDRTVAVDDGKAWLIDTTGRRVADLGPWEWPGLRSEEDFADLTRYVGLDDFFADGLIPWRRGDHWGYVDRDGQWVIGPRFESAQLFHGGFASVTSSGRGQLIDTRGRVVRDVGARWIAPPDHGMTRVGSEMRWGYLTAGGDWPDVLPFATLRVDFAGTRFVDSRPLEFSEGLAVVSRMAGHHWQLVDDAGRTHAAARYDWLEDAGGGLYAFVEDGRWGLADNRLRALSANRFDDKPWFGGGRHAAVADRNRAGCIDRRGRWVLQLDATRIQDVACEGRWLPATAADGSKGVIDGSGRWRIPAEYDEILALPDFSGTQYFRLTRDDAACLARVTSQGWRCSAVADLSDCDTARACMACGDGVCRRLDPDRLLPVGPAYDEVRAARRAGDLQVRIGSRWGYVAESGRLILSIDYQSIDQLSWPNHIAAVQRDELWGVADLRSGQLLVPVKYEWLVDAGNGHYAMRRGGRWGIVRDGGHEVVAPQFSGLVRIRGDLLWFEENDRYVLLTSDGQPALEPAPDWVLRIYDLADYSERAWAAVTIEGELYFIDKRTRTAKETEAPTGYRWVVANRGVKLEPGEVSQSLTSRLTNPFWVLPSRDSEWPDEAARAVLLDPDGRQALPLLLDGAVAQPGVESGPFRALLGGRCGIVTTAGRWIVPLAFDHCEAPSDQGGLAVIGREDYRVPGFP
jgi:hypothetical protein